MPHSNAVDMISLMGSANITVKNLSFLNQYVHTNTNDSNPDIANAGGIHSTLLYCTNYFLSDTFSNVGWCVNQLSSTPQLMMVSNCFFINYDHGVVPAGTNMAILHCHFDTTSNWDTGNINAYHHDMIHYFTQPVNQNINSFVIAGNIFTGTMGYNNTAMIYLETGPSNVLLYNNVLIGSTNDYLNNGMLVCAGANCQFLNNTVIGSGNFNAFGACASGFNSTNANNLFSKVCTFSHPVTNSVAHFHNLYANTAPGSFTPWLIGSQSNTFYSTFPRGPPRFLAVT